MLGGTGQADGEADGEVDGEADGEADGEGGREGRLDGNWVLFPYSLSTLPPFPSMSFCIKLLHEGTSHIAPPWGNVLMSLTDWLTTPRAPVAQLGPARCRDPGTRP